MITIGFSTRKDNQEYIDYIQKTCMYKEVQVIQKINEGDKSLSQVYNEILNESENDIVVFLHDDLEFETKSWGDKLLRVFSKNPFNPAGCKRDFINSSYMGKPVS